MDILIDIDYSMKNISACQEILRCIERGARVDACNHYALRAAVKENNVLAMKLLEREYAKLKETEIFIEITKGARRIAS